MKDEHKKVKQRKNELIELRLRIIELEKSFNDLKKNAEISEKELGSISMELAIGMSEVFEALKKIASGDPEARISEESEVELISKLKNMVNLTSQNIGEIVDMSHEFAMVLAEHFEVLHKVSTGQRSARVSGESKIELLSALKKVTNEMIENIDKEITKRTQMEERLIESEKRYRHLFETSKDGILLIDKQTGNIVNVNSSIVELFGFSAEECIGKNFKDIGLLKNIDDIQEIFQQLDSGGYVYYSDVQVETQKGQKIDTEIYLIDRARLIHCNIRNITERKQSEEHVRRLSRHNAMILNAAGEGILGLDTEGKHTFINPAAARMLGYTVDELTGKKSHESWHHTKVDGRPYPEKECPIYAAYKDGLIRHVREEVFWRKDGTSFPVSYTSTPITEGGKIVGAVVTFRDITERIQAEKEIKKRVKELEEFYNMAVGRELRIKDLKEEIERLKAELEKYIK